MSPGVAGLLSIGLLLVLLALAWAPLGDHMARVYESPRHSRVERLVYRAAGVDPDAEQGVRSYTVSVLAFAFVGIALLAAILMGQAHLPFDRGQDGLPPLMALNTAVSFVTNTNWQSYAGESALGFTAQAAGLTVQNFASAAVGMAIAVAPVRGFARVHSDSLGNFWVDLTRGLLRILLPLAVVSALLLVLCGVVQNLTDTPVQTLAGHTQVLTGGPVASQEAIKVLGTNGGGFFNANSAHPMENPTPASDLLQIFLILLVPVALTRTLGTMLGRRRQGLAVLAVMGVLFLGALAVTTWAEVGAHSQAAQAAGGGMEGKEVRFGPWATALFATATTGTSTGAVNGAHDSLSPTGGGATLATMMLGEVAPGGVGSGLYGALVMAVLAVFVAGLMVGRTPEILGKKVGARQMTCVTLYCLTTPALVLLGSALALGTGDATDAMGNPGTHGFSELLYAFTSAANNNGSAFGGLTVTSGFFQITLGIAMLVGRFVPIVLVLLLAGSFARQGRVPETAGTLPTHTPTFVGLLIGVIVVVTGLTYVPVLALGPIAEALA